MSNTLIANAGTSPQPTPCIQPPGATCALQLGKLMKLRDALIALKGPLASSPGARSYIERRLLNDEVYDRVLGKLADEQTISCKL